MFEHLGWWFPEGETHLTRMLDKSVNKGGPNRYQFQVRDRSMGYVTNKRLALDIGANVGLWSRDLVKNFTTVMAWEPVPMFRECLIRNVPADNLQIRTEALGDQNTKVTMNVAVDNMGHTHVDPDRMGQGETELRTLDSYELTDVDYIKIDCEGFEYRVLKGAEETIKRCRPLVIVEQKPHDTYTRDYGQFAAVELLQSWGMRNVDRVKDDWIMGW